MLKGIEINGFKSFGRKVELEFPAQISAIVGPNGSGKSNVADSFRFVLGEQSMKELRGKRGEDMIWGGSLVVPRGNRAAVKVIFDNSSRFLDIEYPEVTIERVVYRDGQNEYLINGSLVRLKDVIRLLAGANIGGSGYHIISQGEADRILSASPRERREMVEDALGLKLFQHKKYEAERKLEETKDNIEKVRSLRRELAPHLMFLRKQVEKIEKAREMQAELGHVLTDYLVRENAFLTHESARLRDDRSVVLQSINDAREKLRGAKMLAQEARAASGSEGVTQQIRDTEARLASARRTREDTARELGRAEGALEVVSQVHDDEPSVPRNEVRRFIESIAGDIASASTAPTIEEALPYLERVRGGLFEFNQYLGERHEAPAGPSADAQQRVHDLAHHLSEAVKAEEVLVRALAGLRESLSKERESAYAAEREALSIEGSLKEHDSNLRMIEAAQAGIESFRSQFEEQVREAVSLIGSLAAQWQTTDLPPGALDEPRSAQDQRRRSIERLKIKIEESGVGNGTDITKEFDQTQERDAFLARELDDLDKSAGSLIQLISDLEKNIDEKFREGLVKINSALKEFFTALFSGGHAKLELEEPKVQSPDEDADAEEAGMETMVDDDPYVGLTIDVSLPRKKIRGLEVLSGGERALTSIAMIFAMSQVNPPPFLILDETDAALDEANSKRYADMITTLSKRTQLILITHNRSTMSAAGLLYGVTMGQDGVSKLLSVKLEEAERVAK